jgi:predicted DNA-binding protein (UPF0251 family)
VDNQPALLSDFEQLELAITNLRERQNELKKEANDPKQKHFITEWLIDLYIIRKYYPEYKPSPKKKDHSKPNHDDAILFSDPTLINVAARTEFEDPFEKDTKHRESALVRELMDDLTTMEYEAVTMVWLNGLGPTEAAQYMGCTARNVSTYLSRAQAKMRNRYHSSSQMVLSGFDLPPTGRRHRSKDSKDSVSGDDSIYQNDKVQLTFFENEREEDE